MCMFIDTTKWEFLTMKMNKLALACGAALLGASAVAQAEFSANIGVTSNYMWRGITQTGDDAAVSGGIDYAHESGFYLGTWASNVDFGDDLGGSQYEIDFYGGFAGEAAGLGYDLGVIYYAYPSADSTVAEPQADELDFTEIYGIVSYEWAEAGVYYTVDTEAGGDDSHWYYYGAVSFEVAPEWTVGGTVGHYDLDGGSDNDFTHYQLDVTKSAGDFGDFTLSFSKADEEANGGDDDPRVFVSWAKSF